MKQEIFLNFMEHISIDTDISIHKYNKKKLFENFPFKYIQKYITHYKAFTNKYSKHQNKKIINYFNLEFEDYNTNEIKECKESNV